jgi:MFS family permease
MMKNLLARTRIHYGWIIVVVTFITMLGAAGIRATPTVLILPLEQEFGWDRATISLAISINLILFGLCGPFAAAVMERVGMRATMAGALLLLAAAVGLTTQMSDPWHLVLLWGVLVGLGTGAMSGWIAATVSSRWFVAQRGLVVGILTVANATGQLTTPGCWLPTNSVQRRSPTGPVRCASGWVRTRPALCCRACSGCRHGDTDCATGDCQQRGAGSLGRLTA